MDNYEINLNENLTKEIKKIKKKFDSFIFNSIPEIKNENLTANDYIIFEFLENEKKTMNEIATELKLTPGTTTIIIDKLIEKKYLKRERSNIDRRKVFIFLDTKGKKLYNKSIEKKKEFSKKILEKLTKEEQKKLFEIFRKLNEIEFR